MTEEERPILDERLEEIVVGEGMDEESGGYGTESTDPYDIQSRKEDYTGVDYEKDPSALEKIEPYYNIFQATMESCGFAVFLGVFEVIFIILFFVLVRNGQDQFIKDHEHDLFPPEDETFYLYHHVYMEVAVMIFLGFGLLMSFLKLHGLYAVGMAFLISCFAMQMTVFCVGYADKIVDAIHGEKHLHYYIILDLPMLIKGLFAAAAVLISMGVVIGKFTPFQLVIMVFIEIPIYSINVAIVEGLLKTSDAGGSMLIHAFGAYFGVVLSWFGGGCVVSCGKKNKAIALAKEATDRMSELISLIGTISLWIFWPSFCGALSVGLQHRVDINTVLSLMACCVTSFVVSRVLRLGKFGMAELQNATIAGGVAIGALSNMEVRPGAPCIVGMLAATISCFGYRFLSPLLRIIGIHDTCGVHNLHGMPGVLGGLASIFGVIGMAKKEPHGKYQPLIQLAGLAITLSMAVLGGVIAAIVTRLGLLCCYPRDRTDYFEDSPYFILEEEEEEEEKEEDEKDK